MTIGGIPHLFTRRALIVGLLAASLLKCGGERSQPPKPADPLRPEPTQIATGPLAGVYAYPNPDTDKPRIVTGRIEAAGATAPEAAASVLKRTLTALARDVDLGDLRLERQVQSLTGTSLTYSRYVNGLQVLGDQLTVEVSPDRRAVTRIANGLTDRIGIMEPLPAIDTSTVRLRAIEAATNAVKGVEVKNMTTRLAIVPEEGKAGGEASSKPTWGLTFITANPPGSWRVLTDASGLHVIRSDNVAQFEDGTGRVFKPNPIQQSGDAQLTAKSAPNLLNQWLVPVTLRDLDTSGFLQGLYASTENTVNRARDAGRQFNYARTDPKFGEVMAYHWITECQRYLQALGFTGPRAIFKGPIKVDAHATESDKSFYSPDFKTLNFGDGGVPDSEDAQVILHELGHAILDAQVKNFGGSVRHSEARALSEGFSDYWAASFFSDVGPPAWHTRWNKWDGHGSSKVRPAAGGFPPHLRSLETAKKYSDWIGNEHDDGEIWSACLWSLQQRLGRREAEILILQSHYNLPPEGAATFWDGAHAIIEADKSLYNGQNEAAIRKIFVDRGILPTT